MRRLYMTPVLLLALVLFSGNVEALEVNLEAPAADGKVRQGDIVLVKVNSPVVLSSLTGEFDGGRLYFEGEGGREFTAIIGIDMDQKVQPYDLYLSGRGDDELIRSTLRFDVHARNYKVERLTLPDKMVTYDEATLKRVIRESRALGVLKNRISGKRWWNGSFASPVNGKLTRNFGARRIMNGVKKKPHSGVDIKAYAGSRIMSPNGGKVVLVDNQYFGGKVVVIDHGHGLSTIYMHLSRILVNHGEEVKRGEVIGLVGATGRATGPHLHWAAYLNGALVDPSGLLDLPFDASLVAKGNTSSSDADKPELEMNNAPSIISDPVGGN